VDGYARITGPCGDTQMLFLEINEDLIKKSSFMTDGCGPTVACGSKLTTMITNKTIKEVLKIEPQDLEDALDRWIQKHKEKMINQGDKL